MQAHAGRNSRDAAPEKVRAVLDILKELYPETRCSLNFRSPLELLVATVLSAQCTDERVNQVTPHLFEKYPDAHAYAAVPVEELESDIKSTGFFRNKAKNIQACCRILDEEFGGEPPSDLDTLVRLPGIGRKTANVILANAYGIPGIMVDTHVGRVSMRLGLTFHKDPEKIERDLMALIERDRWISYCHQVIRHGREVCRARKPRCSACALQPHCDYYRESGGGA